MDTKFKYCSIFITSNCVLQCEMCKMWESAKDTRELEIAEWKVVVSKLKKLLDPQAEICLTGGEPLLKKGILDLIRFITDNGLKTGLNTNAYLIDEKMAQSIGNSGLWSITLSLESLNENTHDFMRGTPGSYHRVMDAIEYLSKFCGSLLIGISTIISDKNLDDIVDLTRWVQKSKKISSIRFQAMMQPLATPEDKEWYKNDRYNSLWPKDIGKADSVLNSLLLLKEKGEFEKLCNPVNQLKVFQAYFRDPSVLPIVKRCIFFEEVVNINHIGDVYLCPELESLGNAKTTDINRILYSDNTTQAKERIGMCKKNCKLAVNCFWKE